MWHSLYLLSVTKLVLIICVFVTLPHFISFVALRHSPSFHLFRHSSSSSLSLISFLSSLFLTALSHFCLHLIRYYAIFVQLSLICLTVYANNVVKVTEHRIIETNGKAVCCQRVGSQRHRLEARSPRAGCSLRMPVSSGVRRHDDSRRERYPQLVGCSDTRQRKWTVAVCRQTSEPKNVSHWNTSSAAAHPRQRRRLAMSDDVIVIMKAAIFNPVTLHLSLPTQSTRFVKWLIHRNSVSRHLPYGGEGTQ
jgi:hypothetical protein